MSRKGNEWSNIYGEGDRYPHIKHHEMKMEEIQFCYAHLVYKGNLNLLVKITD